jgi:guanylate kinase
MKEKVIVFTAPSGAGKTTIVRRLLNEIPELKFSVSATTRPKRESEIDGKDYYFISNDAFRQKIVNDEFLEWEEVYEGLFYGSLKSEVKKNHTKGFITLFDIDVKGAQKIKTYYEDNALVVFVKPPSIDALKERLLNRKTESPEALKKRLDKASEELQYVNSFDTVLFNEDLEEAISDAKKIIMSFIKN